MKYSWAVLKRARSRSGVGLRTNIVVPPRQQTKHSTRRLSHSFSGALRTFSFRVAVANGAVGHPLLEEIDYGSLLSSEPSALEATYAIFADVIELDDAGSVLNARYEERRAAQWLLSYCDPFYEVEPPY